MLDVRLPGHDDMRIFDIDFRMLTMQRARLHRQVIRLCHRFIPLAIRLYGHRIRVQAKRSRKKQKSSVHGATAYIRKSGLSEFNVHNVAAQVMIKSRPRDSHVRRNAKWPGEPFQAHPTIFIKA
jgi:hypothetical protein